GSSVAGIASRGGARALSRARLISAEGAGGAPACGARRHARLRDHRRRRGRRGADELRASLLAGREPGRGRNAHHSSGLHDPRRCARRYAQGDWHYRWADPALGWPRVARRHHCGPGTGPGSRNRESWEGVMHRYPITVLKFGSSVLCCETDLSKAVQEIYRWTRNGHRVVAVVSAIGSTTDALLARAQSFGFGLSDEAVATLVATGEATSAALLTLALERAGLHSVVIDEVRLGPP